MDPFLAVEFKHLLGQAGSDTLSHICGVDSQRGNPGAFFDAETQRQDIADHKADYGAIQLGHKAGILLLGGMLFDELLEIGPDRLLGNGGINAADFIRIRCFQSANDDIFHGHNLPVTVEKESLIIERKPCRR
ncbi:MAG: hypothetical protein AMJ54_03020 [Deltaproteobacteria bacterium SG8_13]|nr:MAG: hypothetical protein AMJ54_03020 [Deltaproteobacteria bacterium SG8_13]